MWHSVFGVAFGVALLAFVPNCRGDGGPNKMHHGENYQDFLKWWRGDIFR